MALEKFASAPLLAAAWVGTSIGSIDLGLVRVGLVETLPSAQLLGAGVGDVLVWGYLLAGVVALGTDLARAAE